MTVQELEYAFDIEMSKKRKILAKLSNSSLLEKDLEIIANNPELLFH